MEFINVLQQPRVFTVRRPLRHRERQLVLSFEGHLAGSRLTAAMPWRSVVSAMRKSVPIIRCRGAAWLANVTTLAVLIAPFCGRICTGSSDCHYSATIADSADNCHHAAASTPTDSESTTALASAHFCTRHELPAVLAEEQESLSSPDGSTRIVLPSVALQTKYVGLDSVGRDAWWRDDGHPPQATLSAISTSVLRI